MTIDSTKALSNCSARNAVRLVLLCFLVSRPATVLVQPSLFFVTSPLFFFLFAQFPTIWFVRSM